MRSFIHISILTMLLTISSCVKEQFKGSGNYKVSKKTQRSDNYLEKQSGKVVVKSQRRNKKLEKKKIQANKQNKEEEIAKNDTGKKKKKRRNTGKFSFY